MELDSIAIYRKMLTCRRVEEAIAGLWQEGHISGEMHLGIGEDYRDYGLTGELAATLLEAGLTARYARVAVEGTIPFDPVRERAVLPNVERIAEAARRLMES